MCCSSKTAVIHSKFTRLTTPLVVSLPPASHVHDSHVYDSSRCVAPSRRPPPTAPCFFLSVLLSFCLYFPQFVNIVHILKAATISSKPRYPPIKVADVPRPPDLGPVAAANLSNAYLKASDPEAQARLGDSRSIQFSRWNYAVANVTDYINVLRSAGHSDERIQAMLDGTPLVFPSADAYRQLRVALAVLKPVIEKAMGWRFLHFVMAGSSVPGFSQNPLKGHRDKPSKIADPNKSDVDICIAADGVNRTVAKNREQHGAGSEPQRTYITTCSAHLTGVRYGCRKLEEFCPAAVVRERIKMSG